MAPSFVGRREELDLLEARLRSVREGVGSRIVLIEGAPGIGKSALLAAFIARMSDAAPLIVSGDDAEADLNFGLCRQLVRTQSEEWPDSFAAGAALIRMVDDQPEDTPVVIIVDDAHLADPGSLRALTFALRRLSTEPLLTVVSARSEWQGRIPYGLVQLADGQDGHRVLAGLNVADVIDLAALVSDERPSRRLASRLLEHTGGNPLYLQALLSEYPVAQLQAFPDRLPPPRSFSLLVSDVLEATTATTQRVAHAAAVIGDGASPQELSLVAAVDDNAEALEELQRARILRLRSRAEGWEVEFEHPLVRTSVYEAAGPATRAELHTRAADLLGGPNALNHLVAAASRPDPALAARLEERSQDERRADALSLAADSMFAAARLSPGSALADRRFLDAVELVLMSGGISAAFGYSERVDSLPVTAHRLSVQARMAWLSGQLAEAEALAVRAWEMGDDDLEPVARDALAAILSQLLIMRDQGADAVAWAREALTSGRLPSEQAGATRAAAALGLMISGRADEGRRLLGGLDPDPTKVDAIHHRELRARGIIRLVTDDLAGARADLEVCSSVARRELSASRLTAIGAFAETEYRLGNWDASLALAEQSLSLVEDTEQFWLQGQIHSVALLVLAGRGEWAAAQEHLLAAQQMAAFLEDPATAAYADNAAVYLAMCQADARAVLRAGERLATSPHGGPHEPGILGWPVHHVAALVDEGRLDEAESTLTALETLARDRGSMSRLSALARVRGALWARRRERTRARAAFEAALELGDGVADALELSVAHAAYGRFLRRRGERRAAGVQLQLAYDKFVVLGASPFAERVESELVASGLSPRKSADIGTASLTPQEQVVARLVCTGRSNQEVADELVLSVKTVSYHLGNVYTKLDIHSRAQLINHPAMRRR